MKHRPPLLAVFASVAILPFLTSCEGFALKFQDRTGLTTDQALGTIFKAKSAFDEIWTQVQAQRAANAAKEAEEASPLPDTTSGKEPLDDLAPAPLGFLPTIDTGARTYEHPDTFLPDCQAVFQIENSRGQRPDSPRWIRPSRGQVCSSAPERNPRDSRPGQLWLASHHQREALPVFRLLTPRPRSPYASCLAITGAALAESPRSLPGRLGSPSVLPCYHSCGASPRAENRNPLA